MEHETLVYGKNEGAVTIIVPVEEWQKKVARVHERVLKPSRAILGRRLWTRGYFAASDGKVTDDAIAQHFEMHYQMEQGRANGCSISENA